MSALTIKLLAVALRQVSRPIANIIKVQAKDHASFKKVCMSFAQRMHKADGVLRDKLTPAKYRPIDPKTGKRKLVIRPLNDEKAVENGATILSEFFVFGVAGSLVIFETIRQVKKENIRRQQVADHLSKLETEIAQLRESLEARDASFKKLEELVKSTISSQAEKNKTVQKPETA